MVLISAMENQSAAIGLSWAPKIPLLSSSTTKSSEKAQSSQLGSAFRTESELVDGLFVPPRDPRKLNKLVKKNVKDTTGQSW